MGIRALDSPDLVASIKNLKQCCLICRRFFTAAWSQLIHDQKGRPKTSKSWISKTLSKIQVFHGVEFALRIFCSTYPNVMGIRALYPPDLATSIKNLKQCYWMCRKFLNTQCKSGPWKTWILDKVFEIQLLDVLGRPFWSWMSWLQAAVKNFLQIKQHCLKFSIDATRSEDSNARIPMASGHVEQKNTQCKLDTMKNLDFGLSFRNPTFGSFEMTFLVVNELTSSGRKKFSTHTTTLF